jgi:predicted amidophosphoribosyltransferase
MFADPAYRDATPCAHCAGYRPETLCPGCTGPTPGAGTACRVCGASGSAPNGLCPACRRASLQDAGALADFIGSRGLMPAYLQWYYT